MMMISGSVTSTALPTHGVAVRVAFAPLSRQMKWLQGKASNRRACIEKGFFNGGIEFSYDDKSSPAMNGCHRSTPLRVSPLRFRVHSVEPVAYSWAVTRRRRSNGFGGGHEFTSIIHLDSDGDCASDVVAGSTCASLTSPGLVLLCYRMRFRRYDRSADGFRAITAAMRCTVLASFGPVLLCRRMPSLGQERSTRGDECNEKNTNAQQRLHLGDFRMFFLW
ncbi:hypothetical protein OPV22_025680 [Ensete ventricosum]|uniref:Uncharacterized protein n=1 Tax=Ensete ventricosum TaxID=4639 RepID=A0AAV8Q8I8_ENSVE|nr:hypothetical protein OPV22_025680 [Ensete ventricosum]